MTERSPAAAADLLAGEVVQKGRPPQDLVREHRADPPALLFGRHRVGGPVRDVPEAGRHSPRRSGPFDARVSHCTTIRGDSGHRVGGYSHVVRGHAPWRPLHSVPELPEDLAALLVAGDHHVVADGGVEHVYRALELGLGRGLLRRRATGPGLEVERRDGRGRRRLLRPGLDLPEHEGQHLLPRLLQ